MGGGSEFTTIEEELDHVRQYLIIQKMRYEDKLNYTITCEDGIEGTKIPKLILQPIVENALYHGIRPKEEPGTITIKAERSGEKILFTIADDGVGYDPDAPEKGISKGSGVGQDNVDRRIKLHYGEGHGVSVASSIGSGTTVTIIIGTEAG